MFNFPSLLTTPHESKSHFTESNIRCSIHVFDSLYGTRFGDGYKFKYTRSLEYYTGYRVVDVVLVGLTGSYTNVPVFYINSNLARASFSGHRNGLPASIIACITSSNTATGLQWNYIRGSYIAIENDSIDDISLELRDDAFNTLPQFRFIVSIEFYHIFPRTLDK